MCTWLYTQRVCVLESERERERERERDTEIHVIGVSLSELHTYWLTLSYINDILIHTYTVASSQAPFEKKGLVSTACARAELMSCLLIHINKCMWSSDACSKCHDVHANSLVTCDGDGSHRHQLYVDYPEFRWMWSVPAQLKHWYSYVIQKWTCAIVHVKNQNILQV